MDVSPESYARFTAFRQLVYRCSEQLTCNDLHALVYIWMYSERESYRNASSISVLSRLEATGKFSPWNPEGLLEMLREIKRNDLCSEVKDFMKMKWLKVLKKGTRRLVCQSDEDLQATFEVVVAQVTVLSHQIDAFEKVLFEESHAREKAQDLIIGAAQTAKTLSERLLRAQSELYTASSCDNDQYVDLDNYRPPRARSSSLTTSNRKSTCLSPRSLTPTHTAFTKIIHPQTNPIDSELGEYVDMSTLKSKKKPVQSNINSEYVDMSSLKPPKISKQNSNGTSLDLTNSSQWLSNVYATPEPSKGPTNVYAVPALPKGPTNVSEPSNGPTNVYAEPKRPKGPTTVGLSSAVAVSHTPSQSVPTSLTASPCNEYSVPTSSAGSSRHDSLDAVEQPNLPPPGNEFYCNIEELQAQVGMLSSYQNFDTVAEESSTPVLLPEAIYSNVSSLSLLPKTIPPRDIQRTLPASASLPMATVATLPERNDSLSSVEEGPLTSSQNSSDDASPKKQETVISPTSTEQPSKPLLKPKPDISARRSSLGHTTRMRVRSKVVSRSLKCTSVLNTVRDSVLTHQRAVDKSCDKEGKAEGEPQDSNYYTQLHLPQQHDISDEGYAVVQRH